MNHDSVSKRKQHIYILPGSLKISGSIYGGIVSGYLSKQKLFIFLISRLWYNEKRDLNLYGGKSVIQKTRKAKKCVK